jgi:hypothetical protein
MITCPWTRVTLRRKMTEEANGRLGWRAFAREGSNEMGDVNAELASLKSKIDTLRVLYAILFFGSLAIIVLQFTAHVGGLTLPWALLLGGAVVSRLVRQSMVNKYNNILSNGRPGPLQ